MGVTHITIHRKGKKREKKARKREKKKEIWKKSKKQTVNQITNFRYTRSR